MGKSLKGKECGKGIYQRKDGKYSARFNSKAGKRVEKYFDTISEARRWLADSVYEDQHDINVQDDEPPATEMTVNEWFDFWVNNLICDLPIRFAIIRIAIVLTFNQLSGKRN